MNDAVAALLGLEQQLRKASDLAQLFYTLVNQTHRCIPYTQSLLVVGEALQRPHVVAASDLPTVDYTSPYINFAEQLCKHIIACANTANIANTANPTKTATPAPPKSPTSPTASAVLTPADLPRSLADEWRALELPGYVLWQPLLIEARNNEAVGALLLWRDYNWTPAERGIAQHISGSAGHALFALRRVQPFKGLSSRLRQRKILLAITAAALLALSLPVRLSTLAPVEVVAKDPYVVAAPLDGVVKSVAVTPNQQVAAGDLLAQMEDAELSSEAAVARQALSVAQAELKTVQHSGFMDPRQKSKLAELEAQVRLKEAQWHYAQGRLNRSTIRVDRAGVAVLDNPDDWKGRPVRVGERIMLVANPQQVEFKIMLAVKDSIALSLGAHVRVFLDSDPLHAWNAQLSQASYTPQLTSDQQYAYRLVAQLDQTHNATDGQTHSTTAPAHTVPRIGLRGTAKVYGERVSLFFYLFRRPITSVRQWLGW